jgi:purine-binding chemotaxis protein CheW
MREEARKPLLSVHAGGHRAGLPLASVREIMRPLPIAGVAGAPAFVLGLSLIRGVSVPVVDLGALLGEASERKSFTRFVRLELGTRSVALAVQAVSGVVEVAPASLGAMPPLLSRAASTLVETLALHDSELLLVLATGRLVAELPALQAEASA